MSLSIRSENHQKGLLKRAILDSAVGPRLKGHLAIEALNPRRVLLKRLRTWAHPLYDQKVFKTKRFRHDFVMVLDGYQFREISRNREEP